MSKAKQKGTSAETAFVNAECVTEVFPHVERRTLSGSADQGDVAGMIGICVEIKNHASYKFPEWMRETEVERVNAKADYGILVVKPNGVGLGSVDKWWAVMPVGAMMKLLSDAGYGNVLDTVTNEE